MSRLRSAFPVFEHHAYLNAGSVGPLAAASADAAQRELRAAVANGRGGADAFAHAIELMSSLRRRVAALMNAGADEVALTGATTDGINTVLGGLDLAPGDEILTSDQEHPGLLAPLALARRRTGAAIRIAPFADLVEHVGPQTKLVACSHVAWQSGRIADLAGLSATGVAVLADGAQGLGAIGVDVRELGIDFYAASGQKWLCGPVGTGYLYVRSDRVQTLTPPGAGYGSLADPLRALDLPLRDGAARFDGGLLATPDSAAALAALDVLERDDGLARAQEDAATLADGLADALTAAGREVAVRDHTTLVSWACEEPRRELARLGGAGFVVRDLPGTDLLRASVGPWSTADELEALVATCAS